VIKIGDMTEAAIKGSEFQAKGSRNKISDVTGRCQRRKIRIAI